MKQAFKINQVCSQKFSSPDFTVITHSCTIETYTDNFRIELVAGHHTGDMCMVVLYFHKGDVMLF